MQTSSFIPLCLYASRTSDAANLLPHLPSTSNIVTQLKDIAQNRRAILIPHDSSSAREATQWINKQASHRQSQLFIILPSDTSRLTPACALVQRPFKLVNLTNFLNQHPCLPPLPENLKLTEIETRLIEQLYSSDAPMAYDQLMHNIWGHTTELDTHTLETHLYRLRKKLDKTPYQIITEASCYQLVLS